MAGLYDLMLLIDPTAPDERREGVIGEVESLIEEGGGQVVGNYDWGQRHMTFEIDHRPEAEYRLYQFEGGRELLERLHSRLRITDGLLRFRIIRPSPASPCLRRPNSRVPAAATSASRPTHAVAARAAADAPRRSSARALSFRLDAARRWVVLDQTWGEFSSAAPKALRTTGPARVSR